MGQTTITLHHKSYGIACDDGQERRISQLANYVDERVTEIAAGGGTSTEAHLLALTSIVLADEIFELREYLDQITAPEAQQNAGNTLSAQDEAALSAALHNLTERVDHLSQRIKKAA